MSKTYKVLSNTEHVLARPGMYVGSVSETVSEQWVFLEDRFSRKQVCYVPALYKLFDEAISNAYDASVEDETLKSIKVCVDETTMNFVNDGKAIPVLPFEEGSSKMIPEVIFGQLHSGSNFDDTKDRHTAGMNGLGIKLANIFSTEFKVDVCDGSKRFVQVFTNNMSVAMPPKITSKSGKPYVSITFIPDLPRFGLERITKEHIELFHRRACDIAALSRPSVTVTFNKERLKIKDFPKYSAQFGAEQAVSFSNKDWDVVVCKSPSGGFKHHSFVNSVATTLGGTHVDVVANRFASEIVSLFDKRCKKQAGSVKPFAVKDKLFLLVSAKVSRPTFSSQTKEQLVTPVRGLPTFPPLEEKVVTKLFKALEGDLMTEAEIKGRKELSKTDGSSRKSRVRIDKLEDAPFAGTAKGEQCTLIVCEGDSAKTMVMSGLASVDRRFYGVFPLKGKLLNTRDASVTQIANNAEITHLKQILGLKTGVRYDSLKPLRYGKLLILGDQDLDGLHIRGLLCNWLDHGWPELFGLGFAAYMFTPIVKATKGSKTINYYSQVDFDADYKKGRLSGYKVKYYKGLGTSTSQDAREYFKQISQQTVRYSVDDDTRESMDMAFRKARANDRKKWILENTGRNDFSTNNRLLTRFVHDELVQFSIYDNVRSIPCLMDGLKPSQRKILYALLSSPDQEIKVAQLAPRVAERTCYHHGENSLVSAIMGLAQDFVGSNQINLLLPKGQFGSRLQGGKDAASARYVFTRLNPMAKKLFSAQDTPLLRKEVSDGVEVEPSWYAPSLPMVLVNGAQGIGTGFSTAIPTYRVSDIKQAVLNCMEGKALPELTPYFEGFRGNILPVSEGKYETTGVWSREKGKVIVTELPLGVWTEDFKTSLDKKEFDFVNLSTEKEVRFEIKTDLSDSQLVKDLPLKNSLNATNMYLFDPHGRIKLYTSPQEIVKEYTQTRRSLYEKRRLHLIEEASREASILEHKMRFIQSVMDSSLVVFRKGRKEIVRQLENQKFPQVSGSWDMYLHVKVDEFCEERLEELRAKIASLQKSASWYGTQTANDLWKADLAAL